MNLFIPVKLLVNMLPKILPYQIKISQFKSSSSSVIYMGSRSQGGTCSSGSDCTMDYLIRAPKPNAITHFCDSHHWWYRLSVGIHVHKLHTPLLWPTPECDCCLKEQIFRGEMLLVLKKKLFQMGQVFRDFWWWILKLNKNSCSYFFKWLHFTEVKSLRCAALNLLLII